MLTLLLFVGLVLVTGAIALFVRTVRDSSFDHADRLSLLPLDDEPDGSSDRDHAKESSACR